MPITDEQLLTAYFKGGSERKAAAVLGGSTSRELVASRLRVMRAAGVHVPRLNKVSKSHYTPERVAYLDALIKRLAAEKADSRQS